MRDYLPTKRGFTLGVALWAAIAAQGCFPKFDDARMRINPETGETIVERVGKSIPKPGDDAFVGPADPAADPTFKEGKADADRKFRSTINQIAAISYWILIPLAIGLIVASFLTRLIPTKAGVSCGIAVGVVALAQNLLLKYGTIAVDVLAICIAVLLGLAFVFGLIPLVIFWVKARIRKNGILLAEEGKHVEGATAVIASVDPKAFELRKSVEQWFIDLKGDIPEVATEARMQLVKLGLIKPEGK